MKQTYKAIAALTLGLAITLYSCEPEMNTLGSDLIGIDPNAVVEELDVPVVTYSEAVGPVQTNNFDSQPFGYYRDGSYGGATYGFVTQLRLPQANPSFGQNVIVDSVALSMPFFSRLIGEEERRNVYELDSVYNKEFPVIMNVYENGFFLNPFNTGDLSETARYFSDQKANLDNNRRALVHNNPVYIPSDREVVFSEINEDGDRVILSRESPAYRRLLDNTYWKEKIFDQEGTPNLQTNGNFQNYFRGLYFEAINRFDTGNLTYFNLQDAAVIIYYKSQIVDVADSDGDGDRTDLVTIEASYRLAFQGQRFTTIENDFDPSTVSAIEASGNRVQGSENMYLKGGAGAISYLDLFGPDNNNDGEADLLSTLKNRQLLVNDAYIDFFVDQSKVTPGSTEPERIVVYDGENNQLLADFVVNSATSPLDNNTTHWGRLERIDGSESSAGVKYRIRIARHVNDVIRGDKENVTLAIATSLNVQLLGISDVRAQGDLLSESILIQSAISPEGTVLHGSQSPDVAKRPVLKLFFTDPNS